MPEEAIAGMRGDDPENQWQQQRQQQQQQKSSREAAADGKSAKGEVTPGRDIRLSDSVLQDDKLLARFFTEGLAHLQVSDEKCSRPSLNDFRRDMLQPLRYLKARWHVVHKSTPCPH